MRDNQYLRVERTGPTAKIRLVDLPRRNAISTEMIDALADIAAGLRRDSSIRSVILCGHSEFFCAGADKKSIRNRTYNKLPLPERAVLLRRAAEMIRAWETVPQVTIAAIEGYAVGAGVTLSLACDFRVCGKSTYFYGPEVDLGFNFGLNTVPRLNSLIGPAKTKAFIMFCEKWYSQELLSLGLVDHVSNDNGAEAHAEMLANTINKKPQAAIYYTKLAVNAASTALTDVASFADVDQILLCIREMDSDREVTDVPNT